MQRRVREWQGDLLFEADVPKLKDGKCTMSNNAQPLTNGALGTFNSSGPLTVW